MPLSKNETGAIPNEMPPGSPSALLLQLREGLPAAYGMLYQQYAADLLRLAYRILGSRADAEDVLHDLFVGLPELFRHYEERGQLGPWLRAVTARHALMKLRREHRRERSLVIRADALNGPAPAEALWHHVDLSRAIDALPETLRTVFVLKQLEGYSHTEIADLLSISSGASRVRHLRALRHLRHLLEPDK
jgi:RNA polymerase sigma-70 factor (ECF subfamily)